MLEPLYGYLLLVEWLHADARHGKAFNCGPALEANRSVRELVVAALQHWPSSWRDCSDPNAPQETGRLHLQIDKAHHLLGWQPECDFATIVARTVAGYRAMHEGASQLAVCLADLVANRKEATDAR